MRKIIKNWVKVYKMKKMEKQAEIKTLHIEGQIKKIYQMIKIIEKGFCKNRTAKRQFRRDVIDRGFVHATLMKQFLVQRKVLADVLKINPEKDARKQYKLIKKLKRKNKLGKETIKEIGTPGIIGQVGNKKVV